MNENQVGINEVSEQRKKEIIDSWMAHFQRTKAAIVEKKRLVSILEQVTSLGQELNPETTVIPGGCNFGDDPEVFHTVYAYLVSKEAADKQLHHEQEHASVYRRNGVPVELGLALATNSEGGYCVVPMVIPEFPSSMPIEQRRKIAIEATLAVSQKSEGDVKALNKIQDRNKLRQ